MRMLSLLWRCGVVVCGIGASALFAAPEPHATRKDRLVEERDGFRVEYSPGQEAYAEAMFGALKEFAVKESALAAVPTAVQPGSVGDLVAHRDEILRQVAAEIGLAAPTEHQGRIFDAMLDLYEFFSRQDEFSNAVEVVSSRPSRVEIWDFEDLRRRLKGGESLEGYRCDGDKDAISHTFVVPSAWLAAGARPTDEMTLEQSGQDCRFSYRHTADGVVYLTAGSKLTEEGRWLFTATGFTPRDSRPSPLKPALRDDRWARALAEQWQRFQENFRGVFPVYAFGKNPAQAANDLVGPAWTKVSAILARKAESDATVVHAIVHEVVDAGIVENYIVSADRRWLCEGAAEYVAWKVLRDRFGAAFARRGRDLDGKLAQCVALQSRVDLRRWRAPEHVSSGEMESSLNLAHYAFAMRAMAEIARRNGEEFLPKLFREIAKTPREKTSMKTVEKAYRKITGKRLGDVIKVAEKTPVAAGPK